MRDVQCTFWGIVHFLTFLLCCSSSHEKLLIFQINTSLEQHISTVHATILFKSLVLLFEVLARHRYHWQGTSIVHATHALKGAWQPFYSLVLTLNSRDEECSSPQFLTIYLLEHNEHTSGSIIMTIGLEARYTVQQSPQYTAAVCYYYK